MQLTPFARAFIAFVSLLVLGYVVWEETHLSPEVPEGDPGPGVAPPPPSPGQNQVATTSPATPPPSRIPWVRQGVDLGVLIQIPGGSFAAGQGRTPQSVDTFYLDETEVTNNQYLAYITATPGADQPSYWSDAAYLKDHGNFPVVGIPWAAAQAFCGWAGKRLPTGLEWERAARGDDGRELPWGNELSRERARVMVNDPKVVAAAPYGIPTLATTDPTYSADQSPYGVLALAGNVAEWTADAGASDERMVRGGSWASYNLTDASTWRVLPTRMDLQTTRVGFRCAASVDAVRQEGTSTPTGRVAAIRAAGILRIGSEPETPPMLMATANGGWTGFDYEIARVLASNLGASVQVVPGRYSELPASLAQGQFDVIISGYTPDVSIRGVSWSHPYLEYGLCLVVRNDSKIKSVKDLAGKKVGVFNDPAAERVVKELAPGAAVATFEDGYFQLLKEGRLDAVIYDFPYAQEEIKAFGKDLVIREYNLSAQSYAVGVPVDAPELLTEVNKIIDTLRASPSYRQLLRTWLGSARVVDTFAPGTRTYTVKEGDSLSSIALTKYGKVDAWTRIWDANKHRVGNPDLIEVGMKLVLP